MSVRGLSRRWSGVALALLVLLALGPALTSTGRVGAQVTPPPSPDTSLPSRDGSPTSDDVRSLADPEVFGFLPYWELANAETLDLDTLTTLAWFGLEAGRDGRLIRETTDGEPTPGWAGWDSDAFTALLERAQLAGVRVVLTVERFAWDRAGSRTTTALLTDPDARSVLVADIVDVITARGADGVNLDVEPLPREARRGFVRLVRDLRAALDAVDPSLQLTFDLTPDVESYPLGRLVGPEAADAVVLMGYEYRTPASRIAGSVAPLRDGGGLDVRRSVERTLARVPAEGVILALPWYGRAWSTRGGGTGAGTRRSDRYLGPATTVYRSAVERAAVAGRRYDRRQASAWSVYRARADEDGPTSWRQLWYDDVDSVRDKVGFAVRKGLRGVGIWALGYEGGRPELWSALRYALEQPSDGEPGDAQPPVGRATVAPESIIGELRIDGVDDLPVVGDTIEVDLAASDGPEGSGVAFVRLAASGGRVRGDGALRGGTTFPAVNAVRIALPDATPVDEVFTPGDTEEPVATGTRPIDAPWTVEQVTVHVQWRDVAGNWSAPVELTVAHRQVGRAITDDGAVQE